jgi:hypothetical protein
MASSSWREVNIFNQVFILGFFFLLAFLASGSFGLCADKFVNSP